jgi:hypothetical protein
MKEDRTPNKVVYMNMETTKLKGRPRNRWLEEVREDGKVTCGRVWKERVYSREEWNKLLRMARMAGFRLWYVTVRNTDCLGFVHCLILTKFLGPVLSVLTGKLILLSVAND